MNTDYELRNKETKRYINSLKIRIFDAVAKHQSNLTVLENAVANAPDTESEDRYRTMWARYHTVVNQTMADASDLSDMLEILDECETEFNQVMANDQNLNMANVQQIEEVVEEVKTESEENSQEDNKETEESAVVEETPKTEEPAKVEETLVEGRTETVSEESVVEEPTEDLPVNIEIPTGDESVESEAKNEAEAEIKVEAPVVEETAEVETKAEAPVTSETEAVPAAPVADSKEEPVLGGMFADPGAETSEVVETAPVMAPVAETKEEPVLGGMFADSGVETSEVAEAAPVMAPVAETKEEPVLGGMFADPTAEASEVATATPVINIPEKTDENSEIELPTIEGETPQEEKTDVEPKSEVVAEAATPVDVALPVLDGRAAKTTYVNESSKEGKAIIVTDAQVTKLRASKETQKALLNSKSNDAPVAANTEDASKQLEEMMAQLPLLYGEGKTEEAAALSEQISSLSKKLNKVA